MNEDALDVVYESVENFGIENGPYISCMIDGDAESVQVGFGVDGGGNSVMIISPLPVRMPGTVDPFVKLPVYEDPPPPLYPSPVNPILPLESPPPPPP